MMAASSSSILYLPSHQVVQEIGDLANFLDKFNLDNLEGDFVDLIEEHDKYRGEVTAMQEKFQVKFSDFGFTKVHFS